MVAQESLVVVLALTRRRSIASSTRPFDWMIGITGAFVPLFLRPTEQLGSFAWLSQPVQVTALLLTIVAMAFLGRSFAVVAANRGIKTTGAYRRVRHPLYSTYLLGYVSYVVSYPTLRNGLIVAATIVLLNARAIVEERLLEQYPLYQEYRRRTPYRFVPYVY
jgi:protein-S-isoprenylcysteine O-methyltransferase Ste14